MKRSMVFFLYITILTVTSCGGDKKKNNSVAGNVGYFTSTLTTQEGYYNTQNQYLEVGSQSYPPNQQYAQVVSQALQQAQAAGIQAHNINGVMKLRARITAQLNQSVNNYQNGNYNQQNYNQGTAGTLYISSIQFY